MVLASNQVLDFDAMSFLLFLGGTAFSALPLPTPHLRFRAFYYFSPFCTLLSVCPRVRVRVRVRCAGAYAADGTLVDTDCFLCLLARF